MAREFRAKVAAAGLQEEVAVVDVGCHGQCVLAPVVVVEPHNFFYGGVKPSDVDEIIEVTIRGGKPVERLCQRLDAQVATTADLVPFYRGQQRDVLSHCGRLDPKSIDDAIARAPTLPWPRRSSSLKPEEVIDEVRESGLRGRGGAGFPTGMKWGFCRKSPGNEKYVICNADEGDPGAFMDRALLEGVPHR